MVKSRKITGELNIKNRQSKGENTTALLKSAGESEIYTGLTSEQAKKQLISDGPNSFEQKKKNSALKIFMGQFKDVMVMILLAATVVSVVMGEYYDALTIMVIVVINAALGFIQEYRTEKTLESIKAIAAPTAKVIRDKRQITIPAEEVVRGDKQETKYRRTAVS